MLFYKSVDLALVPAVLPTLIEASHITLWASVIQRVSDAGRGWQTCSAKGQGVHTLGFAGYVASVETLQFFHCTRKVALDNT